jgi:cell division protein FtsB
MKMKRWLPIALCCVPGVVIGALLGVGVIFFGNVRRFDMDLNAVFLLIMGFACPIGMGVMMWLMNKNMSQQQEHLSPDKQKGISAADHLSALHQQRQILETEIAELNQIVELEARHEALLTNPSPAPEDMPISAAR